MLRNTILLRLILVCMVLCTLPVYFSYFKLPKQNLRNTITVNLSYSAVANESTTKILTKILSQKNVKTTVSPISEICPNISNLLIGNLNVHLSGYFL